MRRTKIVCTLGPATDTGEKVAELIKIGMDVARLNFSHGTQEYHKKMIEILRSLSRKLDKPITILQDLQGPKLRVGKIKNGKVQLISGSKIKIVVDDVMGDENQISTTYKELPGDVKKGDTVLLDDGLIRLKVEKVFNNEVLCLVEEGGTLSDHKGINLPGVFISQPSFTEKDQNDLLFGIEHDVDMVALSFVRKAEDIKQVKKIIDEKKKNIMVMAKLEKPEAIENLEDIVDTSDGIMIARGDLGVEMPLELVPTLQKKIIRLCLKKGKPVITATQMLESMRDASRPTRAEVSDVANAIFDGTDAVMLSAETATGHYPMETVKTMDKIIREAEASSNICYESHLETTIQQTQSIADAVSNSACEAAEQLNVKAIVAFTNSGFTARMVSKYRPRTDIIAFTSDDKVQHQLNLSWGVVPLKMDYIDTTDEIIEQTEKILLERNIVDEGDVIIVSLGTPIFVKGTTNLMKIHVVSES